MEQKLNSNSSAGTAADNDLQPIVTTSADIAVNPMLCEVAVHYYKACELASAKVEEMARQILSEHKELDEFIMAMGSYFFTYKSKKRKNEYLSGYTQKMNSSWNYYYEDSEPFLIPLNKFIDEWDNYLKITGDGMRFTATGVKVTDW